jgi:lysophospholipase L1-like esterase
MKKIIVLVAMLTSFAFVCPTYSAQEKPTSSAKQVQKGKKTKKARKPSKPKGDWARFSFYEKANSEITKAPKAVFMGDSITFGWGGARPEFFTENNYLCRGIGGQTTAQMLVRFRADVINLKPKYVAIMAGINDIAENNGKIKLENVFGNIVSMAQLAKANGIKVILCSTLPADKIPWNSEIENVAEKVKTLNAMLKDFAKKNGIVYVDYYSSLVNENGGLLEKYTSDGVHIKKEAYILIEPLIKAKIK